MPHLLKGIFVIRSKLLVLSIVLLSGCKPSEIQYAQTGAPTSKFELRRASSETAEGWAAVQFSPTGATVAETLYLAPTAEISNDDLQSTSVNQDATGTWAVILTLKESAKTRFGELSKKMSDDTARKERIAFLVDGKTIVAPFVNTPMTDGVISITGPFTQDQARQIAKNIVGK